LIAAHVATHRQHRHGVAIGAIFLSADSPPSLATECFKREIGALHLQREQRQDDAWPIKECIFSNTSLPRELLDAVGGFNEGFRMREDLELGLRLFSAGAQMHYVDKAIAYQQYEKTSAALIRDAEAFAQADALLARLHPEAARMGLLEWPLPPLRWKQMLYKITAISPTISDLLLVPLCTLGEVFFTHPRLRNCGVFALQMRRKIRWHRQIVKLSKATSPITI
jgi:GT2 family glycosyltransferase